MKFLFWEKEHWIPAFAGMTDEPRGCVIPCHDTGSRVRGTRCWILASAGMTMRGSGTTQKIVILNLSCHAVAFGEGWIKDLPKEPQDPGPSADGPE